MKTLQSLGLLLSTILLLHACVSKDNVPTAEASVLVTHEAPNTEVGLNKDYWYGGQAEISTYDLLQNRYNDVHDGEVVSIFVTEDFLTDKQVKNDRYVNKNSAPILKMNQISRFTTGLYDYSMMTSVFTRADGSATEKITHSAQDWCGQSFIQLNRKGGKYSLQLRSYFETEGDKNITVKADILEDEILNLIRIDPSKIPTGEVQILPSLQNLRFTHAKHQAVPATIEIRESLDDTSINELVVNYNREARKLSIQFKKEAPHHILGWVDSRPSGFDKKERQSTVVLRSTSQQAYWNLNAKSDVDGRASLGLSTY